MPTLIYKLVRGVVVKSPNLEFNIFNPRREGPGWLNELDNWIT